MRWLLSALFCLLNAAVRADSKVVSLAGTWRFALDRADRGIRDAWFNKQLAETIKLPGSLQLQGYGDAVSVDTPWTGQIVDRSWFTEQRYAAYRGPGNIKVPFWLQPDRHYVGAAWYQRDVTIPETWRGKRITLSLERPHWQTTVWVDERRAGSCDSLSTPHEYDLSALLNPGRHRLTIRVDNRMIVEVGSNAHSVSDHTQTNWNGIIGRLTLAAGDSVWLSDVQAYPNSASRTVRVRAVIGSRAGLPGSGSLVIQAAPPEGAERPPPKEVSIRWAAEVGEVTVEYPLGEGARLWDESTPALYRLTVSLRSNSCRDSRIVTFGLRQVERVGTQIAVNGRPVFLRGTLECCIFPLTGFPPMDVPAWKRVLNAARSHGLNHLRFHSWCPPDAAFQAADELGLYLYVECGAWANGDSSVGDGRSVDRWIYAEGDRILKAYGNHPSFLIMSYGNEPGGSKQNRFLGDLVGHWKALDQRRLYTSAAGWPMIPENDFHITPKPRIQGWGQGLTSRINAKPPETVTDYRDYIGKIGKPVISHEIGQWCVYPNFSEMSKYRGLLKPRNFEIFRDSLRSSGMLDQAHDFLIASGKLQTICYKEEIESALRTPGMAGFELLDLHDFPGQGTALVGVLDPFWESKGYVKPEEFRRFCAETVMIARIPKRILENSETFKASVEVANYGARSLEVHPVWRIRGAKGETVDAGYLPQRTVPTGTVTPLGDVQVPLGRFREAAKLELEVSLEGAHVANDWDFWVFPSGPVPGPQSDVLVTHAFDEAALSALDRGGKVLLLSSPGTIKGDALGPVAIGFSPIFWNTAWTGRQPPHTLGILCNPSHPALAGFPTESHSNWQWWELVSRSSPFILNDAPAPLRPVVQVIDDWVTNRRLGLVFEAQVGRGRLLACGIDLETDMDSRPAARQFRRSLLEYMAGDRFRPTVQLDAAYVRSLHQ